MTLERIRKSKAVKILSVYVALQFLVQIFSPQHIYALTSGPSSPDFASFEPVATTDMVSPFTGDFTYNLPVLSVPGPDGGGYALSLSYHSGLSQETEASWVGVGWTLNPGAINRGMKGFPDDYKNTPVIQYNKVRPNWSVNGSKSLKLEYYSKDTDKNKQADDDANTISLSASSGLRFYNYTGLIRSNSFGVSGSFTDGLNSAGLTMTKTGNDYSVSAYFRPGALTKKINSFLNAKNLKQEDKFFNKDNGYVASILRNSFNNAKKRIAGSVSNFSVGNSQYGLLAYSGNQFSVSQPRYLGKTWRRDFSIQADVFPVNVGLQAGTAADLSLKVNIPEMEMNTYGYMNNLSIDEINAIAKEEFSGDNSWHTTVLTDYFVEKSHPYQKRQAFIGIPFNNADNFMLSGEGIGGGFRLYHNEVGHYYPNFIKNREKIFPLGIELGWGGGIITVGMNFGFGPHDTKTDNWNHPGDTEDRQFDSNDKGFFRFNGDLGGKVEYSNINAESYKVKAVGIPGARTAKLSETHLKVVGLDCPGVNIDDLINGYVPAVDIVNNPSEYFGSCTIGEGVLSVEPDISLRSCTNNGPVKRSSYINYKLNSDINNISSLSYPIDYIYDDYINQNIEERNSEILDFTSYARSISALDDRIGEFTTYNQNGQRHVYGLPVYTRKEKRLQIKDMHDATGDDIENVLRYSDAAKTNLSDILTNKEVVGEYRADAYASTYLLTQITGPNYVDVGNNGPDEQDYGSWVKFNYAKTYGFNVNEDGNWYKYRVPYSGFSCEKGTISNKEDDMLSVTEGEREVYNLKTIETKTHQAFFITNSTDASTDYSTLIEAHPELANYLQGSGEKRLDAIGVTNPTLHNLSPAKGTDLQRLERLEKIVLFSKNDYSKPIQTTFFQYDYELMPGTPNTGLDDGETTGKLTLKKVWFEYEGVHNSRIAPYEFKYEYKKSSEYLTDRIATKYDDIVSYGDQFAGHENEHYSFGLDCWGNYQSDPNRLKKLQPWVSQKEEEFDPATWHLKQIILPSGGEIHIQYEQKDYCYVQDRPAMAMVSLLNFEEFGIKESYDFNQAKYYLNPEDLGYNTSEPNYNSKVAALADKIKKYYVSSNSSNGADPDGDGVKNNGHMYFKFLYALKGDMPSNDMEALRSNKSEYVTGYAYVRSVNVEDINLDGVDEICISFGDNDEEYQDQSIPRKVAYDYMVYNKGGRVENDEGTIYKLSDYDEAFSEAFDDTYTPTQINDKITDPDFRGDVRNILAYMASPFGDASGGDDADIFTATFKNYKKEDVCEHIKYNLSYLRVPINQDKKGGGVRVKRLLMYDKGIETGDEALYGSEYIYKTEDGRSSGVATNEPAEIREENPLVDVIHGKKQKWLSKAISGSQKDELEGPIGESLLPNPSIGYSRVVIKNIHTGKTGTGYTVEEFNTCKEWPFDKNYGNFLESEIIGKGVEYTNLSENEKKDWMNLPLGFLNYSSNKSWVAQGFRFILHNMHGLPKKTATYADDVVDSRSIPSTYKIYNYYSPGEKVDMLSYDQTTGKFIVEKDTPGKEMDVTMEMREISDRMSDLHLEVDVEFAIAPPPAPFRVGFSMFPSFTFNQTLLATHATSKVINYPVILKSVESYVDGAYNVTENLAFNQENGEAVLTKSYDSYDFDFKYYKEQNPDLDPATFYSNQTDYLKHDGAVYNWNIPGSWMYPELGQIADDIKNSNQLNVMVGNIVSYGNYVEGSNSYLGNPLNFIEDELNYDVNLSEYSKSILSASATELKKDWYLETGNDEMLSVINNYGIAGNDDYVKAALNDKYNVSSNYVYRTDRIPYAANEIYNSGVYKDFSFFNWEDLTTNGSKWLRTNQTIKYSPGGQALEEQDINEKYSAVKYAYGDLLPVIVANNARYDNIYFNSFEDEETILNIAHSGKNSLNYNGNSNFKITGSNNTPIVLDEQLNSGANIRLWLKSTTNNTNSDFKIRLNTNLAEIPFKKIAQTGEWSLFEANINNVDWAGLPLGSELDLALDYTISQGEEVFMDDIRFQPLTAQATCYVYNAGNFRLLAQFNDQHFGTFYQYNEEGKLVRILVETERGLKTVKETQYNTPKRAL